jgi:hypothetical protein
MKYIEYVFSKSGQPINYSFSKKLNDFSSLVGKEKLYVRSYEGLKDAGLYKSLIDILGLDFNEFSVSLNANVSPNAVEIEAKRRLNSFLHGKPHSIYRLINKEYKNTSLIEK